MLNRLLKYEIKATARKFLPLYAAIIVVSLFVNWGIRFPKLGIISGLSNFLLAALFVSLIAITLITIIQRFKNNLLSNEGYLMFTLPVSTKTYPVKADMRRCLGFPQRNRFRFFVSYNSL